MLLYHIDHIARAHPDRVAVVSGDEEITYRELVAGVQPLLMELVREGLRASHIVAIDSDRPIRFIQSVLAATTLGCRVLPIPPSMVTQARQRLLTDLQPRAVIDSTQVYCLSRVADIRDENAPGAMLHLTSGSYGARKIVVRPFENLIQEALAVADHLGLMYGHRLMAMTPLSHSFGSGLWRATLCTGATLYAPSPGHIMKRVNEVVGMLRKRVDFMFGVPYLFQLLLRRRADLTRLKETRCFAGGETLPLDLSRRWLEATGTQLQQEYGLGEGGIVTIAVKGTPSDFLGAPIPGVRLELRDPDPNGVGELVVYRPHAPKEYLLEGAGDTFAPDDGIWTGDLVRAEYNPDGLLGHLRFMARRKSVIVVAGLKLVPQEVEDAIRDCGVAVDVAVIGTKDEVLGERPVAFVVMHPNVTDSTGVSEIRIGLRKSLSHYKVPKRIVALKELPRTASGKVDMNELRTKL